MRIIITELTRMQDGHICTAGVDLETHKHVRPVIRRIRLTASLLERNGGPFNIGNVVELGPTKYCGAAPQVEDHEFDPRRARKVSEASPGFFWQVVSTLARPSLTAIFGDCLRRDGQSASVEVGQGLASLGFFLPPKLAALDIGKYGKVRLPLTDERLTCSLSVTDLRLYDTDQETPLVDELWRLTGLINAGAEVVVSVGLTRPFRKEGNAAERHWLQVNNIHVKDDPTWRLE